MRYKTRGRPRGKLSRIDLKSLRGIVRISVNHEIDPQKFFEKIVSAWRRRESTCGGIMIVCRKKVDDAQVFLFTRGQKIIAQFAMPERMLKEKPENIKRLYNEIASKPPVKKRVKIDHLQIGDLNAGMKRVKLKARILEIPKGKLVFTRFGSSAIVANVLIGDETGTIKLCLWNEQINTVSVGEVIQVENANVVSYKGVLQLRIGRRGKITVIRDSEYKPQTN